MLVLEVRTAGVKPVTSWRKGVRTVVGVAGAVVEVVVLDMVVLLAGDEKFACVYVCVV